MKGLDGLYAHYASWHRTLQAEITQQAQHIKPCVSRVTMSFSSAHHTPTYICYEVLGHGDFFIESTCDPQHPPRSYFTWDALNLYDEAPAASYRILDRVKSTLHPTICTLWWKWTCERTEPAIDLTLDQYVSLLQQERIKGTEKWRVTILI